MASKREVVLIWEPCPRSQLNACAHKASFKAVCVNNCEFRYAALVFQCMTHYSFQSNCVKVDFRRFLKSWLHEVAALGSAYIASTQT